MDSSAISEWLNLLVRWFHVFAAILWIGSTWFFTWLDHRFGEAAAAAKAGEPVHIWMVHSGGFYVVEKQKNPSMMKGTLHWFKWEAAFTWLSGVALLVIVYYSGGGMLTDPDVSGLSQGAAVLLCLGVLAGGWLVYDLFWQSPLARNQVAGAAVSYLGSAALAWGLLHLLAPRAAYLHMGALFGTLMAANVWLRILPAQRKMVSALQAGTPVDLAQGERAKQRSKQNSFMGIPVVFIMLSNHFPTATYGSEHAWLVLCALILAGWGAAKLLREH